MFAILAVFTAQMAILTYIRPLLESFAGLSISAVSALLLVFGVANFIGTSASSFVMKTSLKLALALPPLVTALSFSTLLATGGSPVVCTIVVAFWGFACGIVPVAWSTWVTQNVKDDTENAGGLQIAVIQLANTIGAAIGGYVYDSSGVVGPAMLGVALMLMTTTLVAVRVKV